MSPENPLETLPLARAMRESLWLFPAVETAHIIGFTILVGTVVAFDLRVLGLSKSISVRALARHLLPWSVGALVVIVPTGLLLFLAQANELLNSGTFQLKMGLLLAAATNAIVFHTGTFQSASQWDTGCSAPVAARLGATLSLVLWASVITCGRFLAYT